MNKKSLITIISIILGLILFSIEIIYLMFFNINNGIKKEDILNYINDINIKEILRSNNVYSEIQTNVEIDKETIDKIISSSQVNTYIKDNLSQLYLGIFHEEPLPIFTSNEIINFINDNIDNIITENNIEITEEQKQEIISLTTELALEIDENTIDLENIKNDISKYKIIITKTIPNILLIGLILIIVIIFVINKNTYDYLLWIGSPTFITGTLFLLLTLSTLGIVNLSDTNDITNIVIKIFPNIIKTLSYSSIITFVIGITSLIIYGVLKYKKQEEVI